MDAKPLRVRNGLVALLVALVSGCASAGPFRTEARPADFAQCDAGDTLVRTNNVEPVGQRAQSWSACSLQRHTIAPPHRSPRAYYLSYLEFDRAGVAPQGQIDTLRAHLSAQQQNLVVYFIHGWRNNAHPDREDAAKFRTILGYMSAFAQQRCTNDPTSRYCGATLTGIYVAWPARIVDEPLGLATSFWTFPIAKDRSEGIATPIFAQLVQIDALLQSRSSGREEASRDRSLLLAHSAGANLALAALLEGIESRTSRIDLARPTLDQQSRSPFSDLIVLVNPASEAENWLRIQRRVREWDQHGLHFSRNQRPHMIALTSVCGDSEDLHGPEPECDMATRWAFTGSQMILAGELSPTRRRALGHYLERGAYGQTHGVVDNSNELAQPQRATSYGRLMDGAHFDECVRARPWLSMARTSAAEANRPNWDTGTTARVRSPENGILSVQWRHGTRQGRLRREADSLVAHPYDPFWNVRSDATITADHGGYVSYPLLCSLAQLWLDDVHLPG